MKARTFPSGRLALFCLLLGATPAGAATRTWNNAAGGDWSSPANWIGGLPGPADDAVIALPGTYTVALDVNASIHSLTLGGAVGTRTLSNASHNLTAAAASSVGSNAKVTWSGGTWNGAGNLVISGEFTWAGGTMTGTGGTTIAAGGTLTIDGSAVTLGRTLTNHGTVDWVAGELRFNGGTLENNATFTAQPDDALADFGGTNALHNNSGGVLRRDTGTGNLDVGVPLTNAGAVDVLTGKLRILGGGSSTGTLIVTNVAALELASSFDVTAGNVTIANGLLVVSGGTINMDPDTYTATGVTSLSGGIFNLNKASPVSNWEESGGTLAGSGAVTVGSGKTYSWSGGAMAGTGTTTVAAGGALTVNATSATLSRALVNNGTVTWVAGQLQFHDGTLDNNAQFLGGANNSLTDAGGTNAFHNNASGVFSRLPGTGNLDIHVALTNAGTVSVSSGKLRLFGGSSTGAITVFASALEFLGDFDVTAGGVNSTGTLAIRNGTVHMTPATYLVGGTTEVSGGTFHLDKTSDSCNWDQHGGTLAGSGAVVVSPGKTYSWTGGSMEGTGTTTISSGGAMTIDAVRVGLSRTLTNNGSLHWLTGFIQFENGTLNNEATFEAQADSAMSDLGGTNAFHNDAPATFSRNTGTGNLDIHVPLTNAGTWNVSTGRLRIFGGGSSTGTINVPSAAIEFAGGFDVTAGQLSVGAPATLAVSAGTIHMTPGTYSVTGTTRLTGGTFDLNKTSAASTWDHVAGTLAGSGAVTVASGKTYAWSGGAMAGTGTTKIASGGTLTIDAASVGLQRVLTNDGTLTWEAGDIQAGNGTIQNNGTFTAHPDDTLLDSGGANALHNNVSGTFTRSTGAGNLEIQIPVTNAGTVHASSGTLRFEGVFTQTAGLTTLNGGAVFTSSGLNVQGGTLRGTGTITGSVFNGGTVAPGASPGILTIAGNYSQTAAGTLAVEINGAAPGTQYDRLLVTGTVSLAGSLTVASGFAPGAGDAFAILVNDAAGSVGGAFEGLPESAVLTAPPVKYRITYEGLTGNDIVLLAGSVASAEAIDVDSTSGAGSDGNTVFEPGETVTIAPSWKNQSAAPIGLSGSASDFTGLVGANYTVPDGAAAYGTVPVDATADCGADCYSLSVTDPAARPATHWDAAFTETPSSADPPKTWTLHLGDSFTDVPREQLFYRRIETLVHTGITSGCGDGIYCPDDPVNRAQMAIFIGKGIAGGGPNIPASGSFLGDPYNCASGGASLFTDVTPTDIFCKHVHYMAVQNVTVGCGGDLYCPAGEIIRSEMAIFVARAIVAPGGGAAVPETYTDPTTSLSYSCAAGSPNLHFTDVSVSDAFCKHVHFLWARNVVSGCSATQYCPTDGVTRDQMARFLGNAFQLALYAP